MKSSILQTQANRPFFVFDVESIGLYGESFAVAGGVYINGTPEWEFQYACPRDSAPGEDCDREWVHENVPALTPSHNCPEGVREAFWAAWSNAREKYPGILMAAECLWPVEARFVAACVEQNLPARKWSGPYPFVEVSSVMIAAGMDPMATHERQEGEKPAHHPLADARQSARLLATALQKSRGLLTPEA